MPALRDIEEIYFTSDHRNHIFTRRGYVSRKNIAFYDHSWSIFIFYTKDSTNVLFLLGLNSHKRFRAEDNNAWCRHIDVVCAQPYKRYVAFSMPGYKTTSALWRHWHDNYIFHCSGKWRRTVEYNFIPS